MIRMPIQYSFDRSYKIIQNKKKINNKYNFIKTFMGFKVNDQHLFMFVYVTVV